MKSFKRGGVYPAENKLSGARAIESLPLADEVCVPLLQHIGTPAAVRVGVGDRVVVGQLIGEAAGEVSANIHAPVSGIVTAVGKSVIIKCEGDEWSGHIDRSETVVKECDLTAQEIIERIKEAGVVGMGGAMFPTHIKLSIPPEKSVKMLIINGTECEPYLTADHRVMLERGEEVLVGTMLLMRAAGAKKARIAIEHNKLDAIAHLRKLAKEYRKIKIVTLKVKYPQGSEKQLIVSVTGREMPPPPALPIDMGVVVCNISTTLAVYEAVQKRKPLIERVVTVSGQQVRQPKNLSVRLGTPVSMLIKAAGGLPKGDCKVMMGGVMMGRTVVDLNTPITKGCAGITIISGRDAVRREPTQCMRCAKCVSACPMGLEPYLLSKLSEKRMWKELEERAITSCIECGCCQGSCPAYLPLLDWVRLGKQTVNRELDGK